MIFEQEKEEDGIMSRPPRDPGDPLFGKKLIILSVLQGLFSLAAITFIYKAALFLGHGEAEARTLTFITLIVSNLSIIISNRSWSRNIFSIIATRNSAQTWVVLGAIVFLGIVISVPFLRNMFHFAPMHAVDILLALSAGLASIVWFEIVKLISSRKHVELLKD